GGEGVGEEEVRDSCSGVWGAAPPGGGGGGGGGGGAFAAKAVRVKFAETPPHPDRIWRCDPTSPRTRGEVKRSVRGDVHPHPPCRGVMISISSPALSCVWAQRLFGTTS